MDHELGGRAYVVSVMDNHSRYILSSALTRSQDLSSYLAVLYAAVERYGWPTLGESTTMHNQATVFVDQRGEYRLESNVPVSYGGRPPHIHVRVRAAQEHGQTHRQQHHRSGLQSPYADYGYEQVGEGDPEGDPERQLERPPAALAHC
jgi:hypothetical protein